jgi:hypothetical protein
MRTTGNSTRGQSRSRPPRRRAARIGAVAAAAAVAVLVPAGCGGDAGGGAGGGSTASPTTKSTSLPPADPSAAVVTVEHVGGLVPPEMQHLIPALSMWSDGTVIQPGVRAEIYPPPALPAVAVRRIDPAAMPQVLATVSEGMADLPDDLGMPPVMDAGSTVVTWRGDGVEQVVTAAALGIEVDGDGLTDEQRAARERLTRTLAYLDDVAAGAVDGVAVTDGGPYEPEAWQVWARPYVPQGGGEPAPDPQRWPGPPLASGAVAGDWQCVVADGSAAVDVTAALGDAVSTTPWTWDGQRWSVLVRPLLPGEPTACPE